MYARHTNEDLIPNKILELWRQQYEAELEEISRSTIPIVVKLSVYRSNHERSAQTASNN